MRHKTRREVEFDVQDSKLPPSAHCSRFLVGTIIILLMLVVYFGNDEIENELDDGYLPVLAIAVAFCVACWLSIASYVIVRYPYLCQTARAPGRHVRDLVGKRTWPIRIFGFLLMVGGVVASAFGLYAANMGGLTVLFFGVFLLFCGYFLSFENELLETVLGTVWVVSLGPAGIVVAVPIFIPVIIIGYLRLRAMVKRSEDMIARL